MRISPPIKPRLLLGARGSALAIYRTHMVTLFTVLALQVFISQTSAQVPTPRTAVAPQAAPAAMTPVTPASPSSQAVAAPSATATPWTFPTAPTQIRALHEQATARVKQIVNQPVQKYALRTGIPINRLTEGWFHDGANIPDYRNADVRRTQETPYAQMQWITSPLSPGVMFKGTDLEFNSNLKFYYTDRNLPKKRLTEAEMVEINGLYRIIGRCEDEIKKILAQTNAQLDAAANQISSKGAPVFVTDATGNRVATFPDAPGVSSAATPADSTDDDTETTIITVRTQAPSRGIDPTTGRLLAGALGILLLILIARRFLK